MSSASRVSGSDGVVMVRPAIRARARRARPARSVRESIRMCSSSAWAPPPRAPRPSRVGTPSAAVKLPSLPPPVEPSVSSRPSARPIRRACSNRAAMAGRSLHRRPVEAAGHRQPGPGRDRGRARGGPLRSRSASASVATRTSISADACAGTTLVVVPPWMTPTLIVVPAARSCSSWSCRTWWASSTIALRALLGRDAGVGGLPFDLEMEPADALPRGLEPAVGQRRLEHQDVGTLRAPGPRSARARSGCRSPRRR